MSRASGPRTWRTWLRGSRRKPSDRTRATRTPCWTRSTTRRRGPCSRCRWPTASRSSCTSTAARSSQPRTTSSHIPTGARISSWPVTIRTALARGCAGPSSPHWWRRQRPLLASPTPMPGSFSCCPFWATRRSRRTRWPPSSRRSLLQGLPRRASCWPGGCSKGTRCGAARTGGSTRPGTACRQPDVSQLVVNNAHSSRSGAAPDGQLSPPASWLAAACMKER